MNNNIPMSTLIKDLNNSKLNNIGEGIYPERDINLDEIIDNQNILDNKFISYLINNCNLDCSSDIPSINILIKYYLTFIYNGIFPQKCKNKKIIPIIRLIHIIGIIFLCIGCFFPQKILKYHIFFCLKTLILWDILDDKCYMSLLIKKIGDLKIYTRLIPINTSVCKGTVLSVMLISILGIITPEYSIFKIISSIIDYLKKYS